jgi:hypothetical protein
MLDELQELEAPEQLPEEQVRKQEQLPEEQEQKPELLLQEDALPQFAE